MRRPMPSPRGSNSEGLYLPRRAALTQDAAPGEAISVADVLAWIRENMSPEDVAGLVAALGAQGQDEDDGEKDGKDLRAAPGFLSDGRRGPARHAADAASEADYLKMFPNANRLHR